MKQLLVSMVLAFFFVGVGSTEYFQDSGEFLGTIFFYIFYPGVIIGMIVDGGVHGMGVAAVGFGVGIQTFLFWIITKKLYANFNK